MNKTILEFFQEQTALTLATVRASTPYCASCFYAFDPESCSLIIKSDSSTRHIREAQDNPAVAGTIVPDRLKAGQIRGVQWEGTLTKLQEPDRNTAAALYYRRHPLARAVGGDFWKIRIDKIKMTDNTLGFGTKLHWSRETNSPTPAAL